MVSVNELKEIAVKCGTPSYVFDTDEVCSPGEFAICEKEGIPRDKIVLSGVNKEKKDILYTSY